jgi:sugar lactone lactonase YvrE
LSEEGAVTNGRELFRFGEGSPGEAEPVECQPGGIAFDAQGRLFVAMRGGEKINVLDVTQGELLRTYDAGGGQATHCHFYGNYLYTTIAAKEAVFRLKLDIRGFDYAP